MSTSWLEGRGASMSNRWTAEYDNIVEFYFWEPQHLNRGKLPGAKSAPSHEVLSALARREVPLNHVLSIFFSLAPQGLIERWFLRCGLDAQSPRLLGNPSIRQRPAFGVCQPDLAFLDKSGELFCELKIDARLMADQLYKYLIFHIASGATTPLRLLIMGRTNRFRAVDQVGSGLPEVSAKLTRQAANLGVDVHRLQDAAGAMVIRTTAYADLNDFLDGELARLDRSRESDQTLHRLIQDLAGHLQERGLSPIKASG